jgi:23S rRNA pseudouridine1911/1915/1917 synthase
MPTPHPQSWNVKALRQTAFVSIPCKINPKVTEKQRRARDFSDLSSVAGRLNQSQAESRSPAVGHLGEFELHPLALIEPLHPGALQGRYMHEHVLRAHIRRDEAEALFAVEPFDCARCHTHAIARAMIEHNATIDETFAGFRLDRALALLIPTVSRERIKRAIGGGDVSRSGAVVRDASAKVKPGEAYVLMLPPPVALDTLAQDIPLEIVFEDEHLLLVNKPAGLVVHPACGNLDGTMVNALLHHCAGRLSGIGGVARPGIVHRIDKDTSGLLVVAKTDPAHVGLSKQFKAHSIERIYTAITYGMPMPMSGTITANLGRSSSDRKKMAIVSEDHGKSSTTHYRTVRRLGALAAVVEARLETGRTHQVRVHLTSIGHPLVGDPVYGTARRAGPLKALLADHKFNRQALHAGVLGFEHPVTGKPLRFEAALPEDMENLIQALGKLG